jgi:hypothetical protein
MNLDMRLSKFEESAFGRFCLAESPSGDKVTLRAFPVGSVLEIEMINQKEDVLKKLKGSSPYLVDLIESFEKVCVTGYFVAVFFFN